MWKAKTAASWRHYPSYLVAFLALVLMLTSFDSVAIGLVLQNIKESLRLTDTELGVLTGIAFSLFYSTFGIPIGRWADRGNRVAIIAVTTCLWSVMVMLVGAARTFGQLLLIRIGVAIGESGCMPPSYSLISDMYSRDERPRAIGKYLLGNSLSAIFGFSLAGFLSHKYGWRAMFVLLGMPGLFVAMLAWRTLAEPRGSETRASPVASASASTPGLIEAGRDLWRNVTFRRLASMVCVNYFFGSGILTWQPAFFMRSYRLTAEQLGFVLSVVYGICGLVATYIGGVLASKYARSNESAQLRALAALNVFFGIDMALVYVVGNPYAALGLSALGIFGAGLQGGPLFSAIQTVVPERMRAVSISILLLFSNLIGTGLGPLAVGALSDALHGALGDESLRYALLAMSPGFLWGAWQLWRAAGTVVEDAARALERSSSGSAGRSSLLYEV